MDITPTFPGDRMVIQSYGSGWFRISDRVYEGPILVFPDDVRAWPVQDFASLQPEDFDPITHREPPVEILLLGCGPRIQLIKSGFKSALKDKGLVPDAMDSGAAARTYNVVMSEERRVCAALFPV